MSLNKIERSSQRIAYICLCHTDPRFIAQCASQLRFEEDGFFVHVDAKVKIEPFIDACAGLENVRFVDNENRIKVYWGGYNSIIATMKTVSLANSTGKYTRYVLLQGQDYPMYSNQYIHDFFETHKDVEFCHASDITHSNDKGRYMKAFGFWWEDQRLPSKTLFRCVRAGFARINSLGIKYRSGTYNGQCIYWGRANWAVTKQCMDYIVEVYENDSKYNDYFKHRFPPDELYFHTIIHNSNFKEKTSNEIVISRDGYQTALNLVYSEYPGEATVFRNPKELDGLRKTGCLYLRKVNSTSTELIEEINRRTSMEV